MNWFQVKEKNSARTCGSARPTVTTSEYPGQPNSSVVLGRGAGRQREEGARGGHAGQQGREIPDQLLYRGRRSGHAAAGWHLSGREGSP